jgi:hypothetical protein
MKWIVLFITICVFNIIVIFMPKRLKISELYATVVFGLFVDVLVDTYMGFAFKAWGFFNVEKAEFTALLIILGIYPAAAAMIINCYPYKGNRWLKFAYLMSWSIFSTAYEWMSLKLGIIWHIHWNLFYSFVMYPIIFFMLIAHVRMYRWIKRRFG